MSSSPPIEVRGATEHNLRNVDLVLDRGEWISIVGPSGSGKTSFVFDVLVAEGERRYLGSLSPKALQFFGKLRRADVGLLRGLPVPIAVGRRSITRNPRSTVGTQSGVLDRLRLVFAREAEHPSVEELTRAHFGFNSADGWCERCLGLGVEDHVDPELLIADESKSIRDGALVPTLPNGYTVYSQVTLEVMNEIARAHGFDVETPWKELTDEQRGVVFFGTKKLKVPFGKHSLESRMKWEGITARPREEGYYRGLVPVIEETLLRNRNENILRFVCSVPCTACGGTRWGPIGREARLPGGRTLVEWTRDSAAQMLAALPELERTPVGAAVVPSLRPIVERLERLGLGHLTFDRESTTLSGGEAQRLRLAAHLTAGLTEALYALDEPTLGLHPAEREGMRSVLDELVDGGNTLVVVEHDPDLVACADRVIELGPGAGPEGGRVVRDTRESAGAIRVPERQARKPRAGLPWIRLSGASLNNLENAELVLERGVFTALVGPSGSGKSSLLFGTLLPALVGERGGPYRSLEIEGRADVAAIDARPMGRSSRSTPATWSGIFDRIRKRFAATESARERKLSASAFSFNGKQGRCETCEGLGFVRVGLHLLEDAVQRCPTCRGGRYRPEVLAVRLEGLTIAEVLGLSIEQAAEKFAQDAALAPTLNAMVELGIGYLELGTPSTTLSSGEAQRIRLATFLAKPAKTQTLFAFDEPDRGLHPSDLTRLLDAYERLLDAGHSIVAISHHRQVWAAADRCVELREGVATARAVDEVLDEAARLSAGANRSRQRRRGAIRLRGVSTHNLRSVDVEIPHGTLTAIVGPSGSGKSSLAYDTIAAEAWHRFGESLPFQVRRFVQRQPRPEFSSAEGLTPTMALKQLVAEPSDRSTLGDLSGLVPTLRLAWSRCGDSKESLTAAHFRPASGLAPCMACAGNGYREQATEDSLRIEGRLAIAEGAFAATRPGRFFTDPEGQHLATLRAAAQHDLEGPWDELPERVRRIALEGLPGQEFDVQWQFQRGARSGSHEFRGAWEGLRQLVEREASKRAGQKQVAEWREPLIRVACVTCGQTGLAPEVSSVAVEGLTYRAVRALSIRELRESLAARQSSSAAFQALWPELRERLDALVDFGLGAIGVGAPAQSLSRSELQRARLAMVLRADLAGVTLVLDEPSAGLSEEATRRLAERLAESAASGNTVLVVTHSRTLMACADHLIALGPEAGDRGGRVLAAGPRSDLEESEAISRLFEAPSSAPIVAKEPGFFSVPGFELSLPRQGLRVVADEDPKPLFDVLQRSGEGSYASVVRASAKVAATTPLHALGAMPAFQRWFAEASGVSGASLPKAAFSYLSPKGRCPACRGSGVERVALDFLADLGLPCPACRGARYRPEVLEVRRGEWNAAEFLEMPVESLEGLEGRLADASRALRTVGLEHLSFGRSTSSLSGGERERLALAALLIEAPRDSLVLFDDPGRGLSDRDLPRVIEALRELTEAGCAVLCATTRRALVEASGSR